ncbi:MAG: MurR/RpiR family transcriptional regulator [Streptococcaceae bacterium]|nr:MurR/RpiR family transcriptional regulator [Streptococcaceae bacterium]
MSFRENISIHFTELTKTDKKITSALLNNPSILIDRSVQEASEEMSTSPAAIMRVVKKLGYKGLANLKIDLEEYSEGTNNSLEHKNQGGIAPIFENYRFYLDGMEKQLDLAQLERVVKIIRSCKKFRVGGIGSSALSAELFAYSLHYRDVFVDTITSQTKFFYLSRALEEDEVLLLFSVSGNLNFFKPLYKKKREVGAKIILVTMNHNTKLDFYVDEKIILPSTSTDFSEKDNISQLENRFGFLIFSEILSNLYFNG